MSKELIAVVEVMLFIGRLIPKGNVARLLESQQFSLGYSSHDLFARRKGLDGVLLAQTSSTGLRESPTAR